MMTLRDRKSDQMDCKNNDVAKVKAPAPYWAMAVLSLIWNGFGAFDFVMTNIRDPAYIADFAPEMVQAIDGMRYWVTAAWALGVWGAVAGSIFLLLRSRLARQTFGVSLLGLAATTFYQFGLNLPNTARTLGPNAMTLIIWIIAVLLLLYSFRWHREGLLR